MKIEKLQIKNFKGITEVGFENLARVNYIVGQNGCGKSSFFELLGLVSKHITEGQKNNIGFPLYGDLHQVFRDGFLLEVSAKISDKDFASRIEIVIRNATTYQYTPNSFQVRGETPDTLAAHKWNALILDAHATQEEMKHLKKRTYEFDLNQLSSEAEGKSLATFLNNFGYTVGDEVIRQVRRSITETQSVQLEIVPKNNMGADGRHEQLQSLSTGYKQFVALYSSLRKAIVSHINEIGGRVPIVCIEEPERSLHPKFQKQIPGILNAILSEKDMQDVVVFVTTHSPFLISASSEFAEQKTYLMHGGYTIDRAGNHKNPSSGYLGEKCLDVAASLLGAGLEDVALKPNTKEEMTIVYCEGAGKSVKDSDVYREIFRQDKDVVFISCGGLEDVHRAYLASRVGVKFVFGEQAKSRALFDCSNSLNNIPLNGGDVIKKTGGGKIKFTEEERERIINSDPHKGYRMLKRKEIENYLFDPAAVAFLRDPGKIWKYDMLYEEKKQPKDFANEVDYVNGEVKDYLEGNGDVFKMELAKIIREHKDSETKLIYDELKEIIFGDA